MKIQKQEAAAWEKVDDSQGTTEAHDINGSRPRCRRRREGGGQGGTPLPRRRGQEVAV